MADLVDTIAGLERRIAELENRLAHMMVTGKVSDIDHDKGLYRMEFTEDQDGKPIKSPWLPRQEEAGTINTHNPLKKGQQVHMMSPGGQVGLQSWLQPAGHSDENPRHSNKGEAPSFEVGNARFTIENGKITMAVASRRIEITGSEIVTYGKTRLNDGSLKVHRVSDKDTAGDAAVDGADQVYA